MKPIQFAIAFFAFCIVALSVHVGHLQKRMQKAESRIKAIESQIYPLPK